MLQNLIFQVHSNAIHFIVYRLQDFAFLVKFTRILHLIEIFMKFVFVRWLYHMQRQTPVASETRVVHLLLPE